ncbi:MAG: thioredoxin [Candidatus Humimicrobiaceae bacterium]
MLTGFIIFVSREEKKIEIKLTEENFKEEVLDSKIPCLVDFWAEWCMPCQMVAPTVESIAKEYEGKIKVCKLNVDEVSGTASQYDVMSIPTLAVFKDGKIVNKIIGMVPKADIVKMIKSYLKEM